MPSSPWTDATDRQLLLSIIHLTGTTLPKWEKVADLMNGAYATDGYTAESTRLVSPPLHFTSLSQSTTSLSPLTDQRWLQPALPENA